MKSLKISVHVYTLQLVGWVFIRLNIEHVDKLINDKFINSSDTTNFYYRHKSWLWHNSKKGFNEKILQGKGKKTKVAKNKPPKIKQTNKPILIRNEIIKKKGKNQKIEFNFLDLFIFLMYYGLQW